MTSTTYWSRFGVVVLLALLGQTAWGQRTVTGTVTDQGSGEALIGASVLVKGTSIGTVTDFDGTYELTLTDDANILVFSYTGYGSLEMTISASNVVNASLSPGATLDEVVVTGYGTQRAREVTGSIASIQAKDFNRGNVNDATQLLQGKVGGLVIARPGSNPNGNFSIRLRGLSTVGASTEPLIVIDGVLGGDLNSIEPQDIESINVLKDGSAAAIYGTRGASGVILITTKRGEAGVSSVQYSGQLTLETPARVTDVLNADEYRRFGGGNDLGASTDWFNEIMQTGVSHIHNLSMSGGTANTTYRLAGNFRDVQGIARTTGFQRLNFRGNITQKAINNRLTISAIVATSTEDAGLGFEDAFRYATIYNPTSPVRDGNTRFDGYAQQILFDYYNPVAIIEQNQNLRNTKNVAANIRGDFELTKDLTIGMFYSQQRSNETRSQYFDRNSFWVGENARGRASRTNEEDQDQLFRLEGNYSLDLGTNSSLRLLGAYEYQDFENDFFGAQGGNFLTDAFSFNNLGAAQDFATGNGSVFSSRNASRLIAFFGRANLNINDTYFLTASLRREGSSRFGADNKWGLFPAISAGVDLVKALDISGFNQLKFRAGYGVTGNNVGQSLLSLQRFAPTGNFFFDGKFVQSFGPVSNPNPNLRWERKSDINVGFDFAMLDYKLTGSIEYYTARTTDGIFNFTVPVPPNLFPTTFFNVGDVSNSGLELTAGYLFSLPKGNSFKMDLVGSYWFTPTLESLTDPDLGVSLGGFRDGANLGSPGQNGTPQIRLEEGKPIGQIWGLVINPDNPVTPEGNWNLVDVDGNGRIDLLRDRAVIGNGFPKWNFGLNNTFNFGNLDINVFFRAVLGHDLMNNFRAFYEAPGQISAYNILRTSENVRTLTAQPLFNSYHVERADFVRLDNMTIGYSLPNTSLPGGFRSVRFFMTGQNLFTITGYSGVSPEPRLEDTESDFGALAPGLDRRNTYFLARGFTFGLNLGF